MTTTRLVFAFSNRVMNKNYLEAALIRKPDGSYPLGEAVKRQKFHLHIFRDVINNRKFTLLGDPALTIGLPLLQLIQLVNNNPITVIPTP
jgi:hypothetical protein